MDDNKEEEAIVWLPANSPPSSVSRLLENWKRLKTSTKELFEGTVRALSSQSENRSNSPGVSLAEMQKRCEILDRLVTGSKGQIFVKGTAHGEANLAVALELLATLGEWDRLFLHAQVSNFLLLNVVGKAVRILLGEIAHKEAVRGDVVLDYILERVEDAHSRIPASRGGGSSKAMEAEDAKATEDAIKIFQYSLQTLYRYLELNFFSSSHRFERFAAAMTTSAASPVSSSASSSSSASGSVDKGLVEKIVAFFSSNAAGDEVTEEDFERRYLHPLETLLNSPRTYRFVNFFSSSSRSTRTRSLACGVRWVRQALVSAALSSPSSSSKPPTCDQRLTHLTSQLAKRLTTTIPPKTDSLEKDEHLIWTMLRGDLGMGEDVFAREELDSTILCYCVGKAMREISGGVATATFASLVVTEFCAAEAIDYITERQTSRRRGPKSIRLRRDTLRLLHEAWRLDSRATCDALLRAFNRDDNNHASWWSLSRCAAAHALSTIPSPSFVTDAVKSGILETVAPALGKSMCDLLELFEENKPDDSQAVFDAMDSSSVSLCVLNPWRCLLLQLRARLHLAAALGRASKTGLRADVLSSSLRCVSYFPIEAVEVLSCHARILSHDVLVSALETLATSVLSRGDGTEEDDARLSAIAKLFGSLGEAWCVQSPSSAQAGEEILFRLKPFSDALFLAAAGDERTFLKSVELPRRISIYEEMRKFLATAKIPKMTSLIPDPVRGEFKMYLEGKLFEPSSTTTRPSVIDLTADSTRIAGVEEMTVIGFETILGLELWNGLPSRIRRRDEEEVGEFEEVVEALRRECGRLKSDEELLRLKKRVEHVIEAETKRRRSVEGD